MRNIIEIKNLCKARKKKMVIKNVSMHIKEGEIYGFLGPNGAGKTTIMKMILNLVKPTSGQITVMGKTIENTEWDYLKDIGNIIENPVFYNKLTAIENLKLHCEYMGVKDIGAIEWALKEVHLEEIGDKKVSEFSLGMKQRLGIARAILSKPKLLILDEPINGLDPIGIKDIRELLLNLNRKYGITILISSHIVSEIESIADSVGIINNGILVEEVSMTKINSNSTTSLEEYFINSIRGEKKDA